MTNFLLAAGNGIENEDSIIYSLRPEFNRICYNSLRASIIYLLIKSKNLNHALSVEEIAYRLGKRHSVVIYHLESLSRWKIVEVIKSSKYGNRERRSIWGLNLKYPKLIQEIYFHMSKTFYTTKDFESMCNINKNVRML